MSGACLLFLGAVGYSQVKLDAEVRPRFEYRHGFRTLFPDNADPAAFVSQRTRLNGAYKNDKLSFYLSLQDIRVWGDVPQLNNADASGLSVHQAWAQLDFNNQFALKLGRQEVSLDDQRIMGSVNWAQQARSHDMAIIKYNKSSFKVALGLAFNQNAENGIETTYTIPRNYKTLQYLWLHKDWSNLSASFLALNNGLQFEDTANSDNNEVRFSQTMGTHLKYNKGRLYAMANLYYQMGNDMANNDISAYLIGVESKFKVTDQVKIGLGGEIQSGNDNGAPSSGENKAFTPLYGTNHKFNGLMDYFYVGNHTNNVGLIDLHVNSSFKITPKSGLYLALHHFNAAADLPGGVNGVLGQELDLVYSHKLMDYVSLKAGYSHLIASDGMKALKGNFSNTNNWGWIMLVIKPSLFESKTKNVIE